MYTALRIFYSQKEKVINTLTSIGMSNKQKKEMLLTEAVIIGIIGTFIGILISIVISFLGIQMLNILISKTARYVNGSKFLIDPNIKMYMNISAMSIALTFIITMAITIISSLLTIRKITKTSEKKYIKYTKAPKFVARLFKKEGELAYKNIRKDKSKYRSIVISIVISIALFVTVSKILQNHLDTFYSTEYYPDYKIELVGEDTKESAKKVINHLYSKGLIDNYIDISNININELKIKIPKNKMTAEGEKLIKNNVIMPKEIEDKYLLRCRVMIVSGSKYQEILDNLGIEELKDGECIINNTIYGTKYGNKIKSTNYQIGETLTLETYSEAKGTSWNELTEFEQNLLKQMSDNIGEEAKTEQKQKSKKCNLKIKGDIGDFGPILRLQPDVDVPFYIIVNDETAKQFTTFRIDELSFGTDKADMIDDEIETINTKILTDTNALGENTYKVKNKIINEATVKKILVYSFVVFISVFSIINTFNTIYSAIILNKREIAVFKSIGMSNRQIHKMLFLEGLFYGLDCIIYGILISVALLYIIYLTMEENNIYGFNIKWNNLALAFGIMYLVIFVSVLYAKNKIKNNNIIDEIKDENI